MDDDPELGTMLFRILFIVLFLSVLYLAGCAPGPIQVYDLPRDQVHRLCVDANGNPVDGCQLSYADDHTRTCQIYIWDKAPNYDRILAHEKGHCWQVPGWSRWGMGKR